MLDIKDLNVWFFKGTVNQHHALQDFSFHGDPGEFVTLIGSNGAGKSTLFNAICGTVPVDSGAILLDGKNITYRADHKRAKVIGRLFQDPMKGTAPDMTLEENLALAYARGNRGALSIAVRRKDRAFFHEALAAYGMGLENRMKTKVGQLSGGQRQAMTLLMATIANPKLLLLDEHTAALDPATAQTVMDITRKIIRERKLTTLMITHNIQDALKTGTRTVMMDQGWIILDLRGQEREDMTVEKLMKLYQQKSGKQFAADRVLLTNE